MRIFQVRKPGALIPTGLSWQWVGGPIMRFMPTSRAWMFRLRLRYYNAGYTYPPERRLPPFPWKWNLGLFVSKIKNADGAPYDWHFEWTQLNRRPIWRVGQP